MNWLDKYQNKILIGIWTLIFLTCLFVIFTEPVKAATSGNENSLPFVVENNLPEDYSFYRENFEFLANAWGYNPTLIERLNWDSDKVIAYTVLNDGGLAQTVIFVPYYENSSYSITLSDSYSAFDITSDYITIGFTNYDAIMFNTYQGTTNFYGYNFQGGGSVNFFSSFRFPVFISGNFVDSQDNVVLSLTGGDDVINHGHSSPPVDDSGHYIDDGNGNRIPKPNKPNPSVYTPPTIQFPSVDTSSLEKLLESLIDLVQYFISYIGGVINGWFSNLLSNLDNWFDYVVQSFNYAINNVVGAIKDLAETFYNNMVSLFEPLYDFFNGVATFFNSLIELGSEDGTFSIGKFLTSLIVPDSEDLANALIDADIHGTVPFILSVKSAFTNIFNNLSNLTPTKVFILPTFTWHNQTYNLSIDFSWYDNYKIYGDTIISGFLILFYLHWIYLNISSTLRGGSAIGHDLSKGGQ